MLIVGGGWLILLPAFILYVEDQIHEVRFRSFTYVIMGFGMIMAGAILALHAGYYLILYGKGMPLPLDPPSQLVTCGPYQQVQNPQAIAMTLMVLGEVIAIDSNWLWLMMPFTIIYLEWIVGPFEKKQMTRQYGSDYAVYAAKVPRWIPRWFK
jgi:protein-S-isoprenylcysteine O-methyltransferase Ste14